MSAHEEEQIALMKDWWQRNGKPLLVGGVLALAGIVGWQAWQNHQHGKDASASSYYQQLLELAMSPEPKTAELVAVANKLNSEHAGSAQAQYASLFVAKVAVESGKFDDAVVALQSVLQSPANAHVADIAEQRLARVLAAQGKVEEGLAVLAQDGKVKELAASREEVKGDLLLRLGRTDEARSAYEKAKAALSEDAGQGTLQMKLDDLAKEEA